MSTFDYPGMRAATLQLLTLFGNEITLTKDETASTYDPVAKTFSGGAPDLTGTGVLLAYKNFELRNTDIKTTDRKLLFQGDALIIGYKFDGWRVYQINDIDPDESGTILTIAQMRK